MLDQVGKRTMGHGFDAVVAADFSPGRFNPELMHHPEDSFLVDPQVPGQPPMAVSRVEFMDGLDLFFELLVFNFQL
jgi:hypothetical protein